MKKSQTSHSLAFLYRNLNQNNTETKCVSLLFKHIKKNNFFTNLMMEVTLI